MTSPRQTMMWQSNLTKASAALALVSLGAACQSSDGANAPDGSKPTEAGDTDVRGGDDVENAGDAWNGDGADTRNYGEGGNATDSGADVEAADAASLLAVDLATAGNYVILAKSAVSTVPPSAVTGNVGISPAAASYITGFALVANPTNVFATSPQVTGMVYASDYATPTPANLTSAIGDMQLAFTDAAGRAPNVTNLGAGNIGGKTLTRGVYKWGTGLLIPTDVTLTGSATDVWIFQVAQNLTVSNATSIDLTGGAVSKNVFWEVAGAVDLGTTAHFQGVIMSQTSITLRTGASVNGRLLAQTAISIDDSAVVAPAP